MIESQVEKYFRQRAVQTGALTWKLVSTGSAGVPDRILVQEGHTYFVELKRPMERPRDIQRVRARQLRARGAKVFCISSKEQVDRFMIEAITKEGPDPDDYDPI